MASDDPVPAERIGPTIPEGSDFRGHYGEFSLYGSDAAEAKWIPCSFAFCPSSGCGAWGARELREAYRWNDAPDRWRRLAADGTLHRLAESNELPARAVVVAPLFSPGEPTPGTIVVPPDALDMIGIRASVADGQCDIQALAGRREIAAKAGGSQLSVDVTFWADGLRARLALAPRIEADLLVESRLMDIRGDPDPVVASTGVTPLGLARWEMMQVFRQCLKDEWTPSDCARVIPRFRTIDGTTVLNPPAKPANQVFASIAKTRAGVTPPRVWTVLDPLTTASADTVSCVRLGDADDGCLPLPVASPAGDASAQGWNPVNEAWCELAFERIADLLGEALGHRPEMRLLTRNEPSEGEPLGAATDMLLIEAGEAVLACTWPTWQRQPSIIRRSSDHEFRQVIPMVAAREIPSIEEVQELAVRVRAREQETRHESENHPAPALQPAM